MVDDLVFLDEFLTRIDAVHERVHSFLQLRKQLESTNRKASFLKRLNETNEKARKILEEYKGSSELKKLLKKHELSFRKAKSLFKVFESEAVARKFLEKKFKKK